MLVRPDLAPDQEERDRSAGGGGRPAGFEGIVDHSSRADDTHHQLHDRDERASEAGSTPGGDLPAPARPIDQSLPSLGRITRSSQATPSRPPLTAEYLAGVHFKDTTGTPSLSWPCWPSFGIGDSAWCALDAQSSSRLQAGRDGWDGQMGTSSSWKGEGQLAAKLRKFLSHEDRLFCAFHW